MYATGENVSELFVLLLLDTFWRFLAGLPTNIWNEWLPRQRIPSVHWPWRQGQLRGKKDNSVCSEPSKKALTKQVVIVPHLWR